MSGSEDYAQKVAQYNTGEHRFKILPPSDLIPSAPWWVVDSEKNHCIVARCSTDIEAVCARKRLENGTESTIKEEQLELI